MCDLEKFEVSAHLDSHLHRPLAKRVVGNFSDPAHTEAGRRQDVGPGARAVGSTT